jgi:murein DD-endopeptidase MepM/ murein hydrolase activator NlpD
MVRTQKDVSRQAMTELQAEVSVLEEIIARLEKQRLELARKKPGQEQLPAFDDFSRFQGQLPWPTEGKVISHFGAHKHPVFKTTTINQGIDIQAPQGTGIDAVASGQVIIVDWLRGYGKFLILDHHDGYYTLYAHASEILVNVGDGVEAGQCVARVGETGSLQGPLLHFEIRKGQKELDPLLWLTRK